MRLATKMVILASIFAVFLSVSLFFILRVWVIPDVESEIKKRVLSYSKMAAGLIDGDSLQKIMPEGLSTSSAEYKQILKVEREMMASDGQIDDVYTMVATDDPNMVRFVVDGFETRDWNADGEVSPEETTAVIGEEYDVTDIPVLRKAFLATSITDEYYSDKWGTFMTSASPVKNSRGVVVGIVGVDIRFSEVLAQERQMLIRFGLYAGAFLVITLVLVILLSWLIERGVGDFNRSIMEISGEGATGLLNDSGGDELSELSRSINNLVVGLRESRDQSNKKVVEKTRSLEEKVEQLEKLNKLMVGREVIMYELKKELKEAKNERK